MRRITQTLTIRQRVEGEPDRYGNPTLTWVDEAWPVYGVSPRAPSEPDEANRDAVYSGLQVFAPVDGPRPGPHDRVIHGGEEWQTVGDAGVWDNNPHFAVTRQRGVVVNLDRPEG